MRCDSCKYWEEQTDEYSNAHDPSRVGLGECKKATMLSESTGFRKQSTVKEGERILPTNKDDWWSEDDEPIVVELDESLKMYVTDVYGYSATLYTKPDFFCAHFEEKDNCEKS